MPIENERKYVLRVDASEKVFSNAADFMEDIEQSYLMCSKKQSARIRKTLVIRPDKHIEFKYTFTFKQDIGKKTVEIETPLELDDYNLLVSQSVLMLRKVRYRLGDWEVDFFKSNKKTYFVQAEIELPVKKKKPDEIPPLIRENLILVVKRGDGRFSSKKLGDPRYAQRLMQTLLLESRT